MLDKLLGAFLGLAAALFALGFVLPDRARVARAIVIDAPPEDVFALLANPGAWPAWSPWQDTPSSGASANPSSIWGGDLIRLSVDAEEIIALARPGHVVTRLDLGPIGGADAAFTLTPLSDGRRTQVVWVLHSNMREGVPFYLQPVATYMGYMASPLLGPACDDGLARLKRAAEAE